MYFVIFFSGDLFSGFKSFKNLELGVSEFWQLFPTHILSLDSALGFCHGIAKGGIVKLNLFNYVLALFRAKFACNLTFRNTYFQDRIHSPFYEI